MKNSFEIKLMTKYLLRKVISKYKDKLKIEHEQLGSSDLNTIDIRKIFELHHADLFAQVHCLEQIEMLVNMYQVSKEQNLNQEAEQLELKILNVLGFEIEREAIEVGVSMDESLDS